ncbi:SAS complex subunit [Cladophialophora chaetospira]|uniref:histone acetyltransferase n=1 Tax=Cladophialophora chaetospira TaxID=386627 RepID=A0AA39CDE0_9EURO|nr:SAS complex subunit [Cladophialophora chaetospira]
MPSAIDKATTTSTAVLPEGSPHRSRRASLKILNRNIHSVVLGNLLFDAWYYSPYPDNIVLQQGGIGNGSATSALDSRNGYIHSGQNNFIRAEEPVCPRLYVCPCCFRYTPVQHQLTSHLAQHRHLRASGQELNQPVPDSAFKVYEWEGYAIWEIEGEKEKLYCQNLSLFGKLFLEQKSVFFDTSGFKYYVLTYTKPENSVPSAPTKTRGRKRSSSSSVAEDDDMLLQTRVLGFFSKENLSWDANNLACILVFPPFQHRQLGQLLMAVSYKLSGWEWEGGIIGGPEKPLSAMGRKSYLRFWSERIARFMMGQSADADAKRVFDISNGRNRKTVQPRKEEMTIKEIGNRTGMLGEDVVAALTEMGICKTMGPKRKKPKPLTSEANGTAPQAAVPEVDADELATMIIQRSKIVEWAEKNRVDLVSPVKEEGFLGEWALSDLAESESSGNGSPEVDSDA